MLNLCIYCGKNEANEMDHIPPRSFFPKPRPSNLITVPSCSKCNREYGKIDEIVRNLLTSIDSTEIHPAFELNTTVMNDFIERMGRGLLFHYCGFGFGDYKFGWKLSPQSNSFYGLPENLKNFILSGRMETFGNKIFSCVAYTYPEKIQSLWLHRFYDGIEFMLLIKE